MHNHGHRISNIDDLYHLQGELKVKSQILIIQIFVCSSYEYQSSCSNPPSLELPKSVLEWIIMS